MSLAAFSGFAQGLGAGLDTRQRRKDKLADDARADAMLAVYERMPMGVPGMGADGQPVAYAPGGTGRATGGTAKGWDGTLLGVIDRTEGGADYDTLFGHSQNGGRFDGVKVSEMTLAELEEFQNPSGAYGQWVGANNPKGAVATPAGRFQIVGTTLRGAAGELGLTPDTKFTPKVQVQIAEHLAGKRLAGASSPAAKRAQLRAEWDGFNSVSDADLDKAIAGFEANGNRFYAQPKGVSYVSGTPI